MGTRVCRRCGVEKDLEADFFKSEASKGGRNTQCKACVRETRIGNPRYFKVFTCAACSVTFQRQNNRGSWSLCPDCAPKGRLCKRCGVFKPLDKYGTGDAHRNCSDGCYRAAVMEKRYGLAEGTFETVLAGFDERCAICGATESTGTNKSLVIDHCHTEGSIRGLLCRQCNCAIGLMKDDPALFAAAIKYLKRTRQLSFDEAAA